VEKENCPALKVPRQCLLIPLVKVRYREGKTLGIEQGKALGSEEDKALGSAV
jgi:hypothetical protein